MGSPRSVLHPPAVPGKAKTVAALPSHHPLPLSFNQGQKTKRAKQINCCQP